VRFDTRGSGAGAVVVELDTWMEAVGECMAREGGRFRVAVRRRWVEIMRLKCVCECVLRNV
jgi:hypothetical protein